MMGTEGEFLSDSTLKPAGDPDRPVSDGYTWHEPSEEVSPLASSTPAVTSSVEASPNPPIAGADLDTTSEQVSSGMTPDNTLLLDPIPEPAPPRAASDNELRLDPIPEEPPPVVTSGNKLELDPLPEPPPPRVAPQNVLELGGDKPIGFQAPLDPAGLADQSAVPPEFGPASPVEPPQIPLSSPEGPGRRPPFFL